MRTRLLMAVAGGVIALAGMVRSAGAQASSLPNSSGREENVLGKPNCLGSLLYPLTHQTRL